MCGDLFSKIAVPRCNSIFTTILTMTVSEALVDHCDVLVVGAGPAGLVKSLERLQSLMDAENSVQMMATWLAKCGIDCRIIDKRNSKIFNGQADGEMLAAQCPQQQSNGLITA